VHQPLIDQLEQQVNNQTCLVSVQLDNLQGLQAVRFCGLDVALAEKISGINYGARF